MISKMLSILEMEGFVVSYAQGAEDLIIKKLLSNKKNGFYLDIGCNNPIQNSNTFRLYLKGWRGICIDGNADFIKRFSKIRKRDICLHAIVSDEPRAVSFYINHKNPGMSSIEEHEAHSRYQAQPDQKIVEMQAETLNQILDKHLGGRNIDLLTTDVEGHDLKVLQGLDLSRYRPTVICVEYPGNIMHVRESEITTYLSKYNYEVIAIDSENVYYRQDPRS